MTLDRRVHIRVRRILVMHCGGFVELREHVCCWRLQGVGKLSRVGGIIKLRGGKVIRGGRGLGDMDVLLLGLRFGSRVAGLEDVRIDCGSRGDED